MYPRPPLEPLSGFEAKLVSSAPGEKHRKTRIYADVRLTCMADHNLHQTATLHFGCERGAWIYKDRDLLTRLACRVLETWPRAGPRSRRLAPTGGERCETRGE